MTTNQNQESRRKIAARNMAVYQKFARYLSQKSITPNQISLLSIAFAFVGMLALLLYPKVNYIWQSILLAIVLLMIFLRVSCNLLDGLVAVEGGKQTKSGGLFNDAPDRVADSFFLIGCGFATAHIWGIFLGFTAALLAMATAYIRNLNVANGALWSFKGPMAKPQRMAVLSMATCLALFSPWINFLKYSFWLALVIICIGCIVTCYNRLKEAYNYLEQDYV
ncbi:MAG: CDP-alcohol phosphatidyltransferase family protein [Alphaproteobacteria bacterium]